MDSDHHPGLARDLAAIGALQGRRRFVQFMAASCLPLLACREDDSGACPAIPRETGGPYPGDGTNTGRGTGVINALTLSGIVRGDLRASVGGVAGTADGVPLTITLTVVNSKDCAPLANHAVYLGHCDRDGNYSLYDIPEQNYLRGVQRTDDAGKVTFTTIFPGCYAGRSPHMHFEVFPELERATDGDNAVRTSQLTFPEPACAAVYATAGYGRSVGNYAHSSLSSDNVFGDDVAARQIAAVTGSVAEGYVATLTLGVVV